MSLRVIGPPLPADASTPEQRPATRAAASESSRQVGAASSPNAAVEILPNVPPTGSPQAAPEGSPEAAAGAMKSRGRFYLLLPRDVNPGGVN